MARSTAFVVAVVVVIVAATASAQQPAASDKYRGQETHGRYYEVVRGHDITGTGTFTAGLAATLSPEDWIVGTPAYQGSGGPTAVRVLDEGVKAPMGITPTEQTGNVLVKEAERWPLAVDDCWNVCRPGTCCMPGSVTCYCVLGCELHRLKWICDPMPQNLYVDVGPISQLAGKMHPMAVWCNPCLLGMRPHGAWPWCAGWAQGGPSARHAAQAEPGRTARSPDGCTCAVCGRVGITPLIDCWDVATGYRAVCPTCAANWPCVPVCP